MRIRDVPPALLLIAIILPVVVRIFLAVEKRRGWGRKDENFEGGERRIQERAAYNDSGRAIDAIISATYKTNDSGGKFPIGNAPCP